MRSWQFRDVFVPLVLSRLTLMIVAWIAMSFLHHVPGPNGWEIGTSGDLTPAPDRVSPGTYAFINMWSRWDAGWYYQIAATGYKFLPGEQSNLAFFPAYPLLTRAVHAVVSSPKAVWWFLCGILVSNAALFAALVYLYLLTRLEFGEQVAHRAVLYLLVFPTTLFLSAAYADSLLLAFTIGSFYHARRGQWWLAGILGCGAALSRPPGILVFVGLTLEYVLQCNFNWRKLRPNSLALGLAPLGLISYLIYQSSVTGSATAPMHAQSVWGHVPQNPLQTLLPFFQKGAETAGTRIDLAFTLGFLGLVSATVIRLRASYGLYSVASLLFITMWSTLLSVPRYVLGIFPVIILLALWGRNEFFHRAYVPMSAAIAALFMAIYAVYGWVA